MADFGQAGGEDRVGGGWRAIGSAWLMMALVVGLFIGFSALAQRCEAWSRPQQTPTHVVVPRHDPACDAAAPTSPDGCLGPATLDEGTGTLAPPL